LIITKYVPVAVVQENTITEYVTITVVSREVVFSYFVDYGAAIIFAFGGFCILVVYIAIRMKHEEEKPIKKLTLDDLLEEFRKG
jgi:uncharacterized membrane protein